MLAKSPTPPSRVSSWLHRCHVEQQASTFHNLCDDDVPAPVPLLGGPELALSEAQRRASLAQILQRAVNSQELRGGGGRSSLQRNPQAESLSLDESNIIIDAPDGTSTPLIPLLFADVIHAPVRKKVAFCRSEPASHVVLIAPRSSAELAQDTEGCRQVWLLCLGRCSEVDLNCFLFNLGRRGALRWDVKQCYSINRRCRGVGGQGAVFTGSSRLPQNDVEELRILRESRGQLVVPGVHDLDQAAVKVWGNGSMAAFRAEVGNLQKMGGHPNISTLLGVFCELGEDSAQRPQWVMVMELCPGGDLFDLVSDGVIPQENVLQIMVGVFSALTYAHAHNIVHRDVKAENVVLHGERAVLIDFGIACRIDDTEEMRRRVGSPGYVAPEIIRGKRYNELVDIFAAGVIIYFLLCGRLPFAAEQQEAVLEKTVKCDVHYNMEAWGRVTPPLLNMVRQMITPSINSRPSARACYDIMNAIASRAVRMSEAFRIAKAPLEKVLGHTDPPLPGSPSNSRSAASTGIDLAPQDSTLLRSGSLVSMRSSDPANSRASGGTTETSRQRAGSASVWQLIQELPSAAKRSIQRISNSGSFTAMRQMCHVASDLPKVALAKLSSINHSVSFTSNRSSDSGRIATLQLAPVVPENDVQHQEPVVPCESQPIQRPVMRRPRTGSRLAVPATRSSSK